ncbi:MAG TPA: hypothetical protein PKN48_00550 [Bacteroidales bacterium]|nr:hypothetical protein [Bacteroidales bacterium]
MKALQVKFQKLQKDAKLPEKAYAGDAGWDIFSIKRVNIPGRGQVRAISLGFSMAIPEGYFARIEGRSSLHTNTTLIHKGTPIDSGYRGEVFAIVGNTGDYPLTIEAGQKFGQMVFYPILDIKPEFVDLLPVDTERGTSCLGESDAKNITEEL